MWTPILNNIVVIAAFGAVHRGRSAPTRDREAERHDAAMILLVGGGTLLGIVVQAIGLLPALRKVGFRFKLRGQFRELGLRELAQLGGWMFCYVAVSQLGLIVLFNLLNRASERDAPGPLIYNNVFLLVMMAHGIIAVSIITALLPADERGRGRRAGSTTSPTTSPGAPARSPAVLAPIAVCYAVLAYPIAVALFQYGAFTAENADGHRRRAAGRRRWRWCRSRSASSSPSPSTRCRTPARRPWSTSRWSALRVGVQLGLFAVLSAVDRRGRPDVRQRGLVRGRRAWSSRCCCAAGSGRIGCGPDHA